MPFVTVLKCSISFFRVKFSQIFFHGLWDKAIKNYLIEHAYNEVFKTAEIGKVLISKNYPFAIIKYTSDKFDFNSIKAIILSHLKL